MLSPLRQGHSAAMTCPIQRWHAHKCPPCGTRRNNDYDRCISRKKKLLVALGITTSSKDATRNKKLPRTLLGAPGLTTTSKDATNIAIKRRSTADVSWHDVNRNLQKKPRNREPQPCQRGAPGKPCVLFCHFPAMASNLIAPKATNY